MDHKTFAESTLELLQADPSRYRNFGIYWYLVKALLKKYYTQDNFYLLGDYVDRTVTDRLPDGQTLDESLDAAIEEYRYNAVYNLGRSTVLDDDGEEFILMDQDADGL